MLDRIIQRLEQLNKESLEMDYDLLNEIDYLRNLEDLVYSLLITANKLEKL